MAIRPLSKELQERAIRELNEVPSRIQEDLNHIKEWINKQPHLKAKLDDQWLIGFLRGCKYSLQRTKEKLELYYTMHSVAPELFGKRDVLSPEVHAFFNQRVIARLPNETNLDRLRFLFKCKNFDINEFEMVNAFKSVLMIADTLTYKEESSSINGVEMIFDVQSLDYRYLPHITPTLMKKIVILLQEAYPQRVKAVYFINLQRQFEFVINIILSVSIEKQKKRLHVFSKDNINNLYTHIPREVLPDEYGGCAGSFNTLSDNFRMYMENQREWLLQDSITYGCDETKRVERSKYKSKLCSLDGSFRKLEID